MCTKEANELDKDGMKDVGKKIISHSTFRVGDWHMHQLFLDSIANHHRFGQPHLFITITLTEPNQSQIADQHCKVELARLKHTEQQQCRVVQKQS